MRGAVPQIVQYQGSKRMLAPQILEHVPFNTNRLVEPFSGMAAVSIAASYYGRSSSFILNDINEPIIGILESAIESPEELVQAYSKLWNQQFTYPNHVDHFYDVRDRFNSGDHSPEVMLYLIARCVKGSVRYNKDGLFNQSPDKRRHGTRPENLLSNCTRISKLMRGKVEFYSQDYRQILEYVKPGDLVYMDPPYQGVSETRDQRYYSGLSFNEFVDSIYDLDSRGIDYIISYDGLCGDKKYGTDLPADLNCSKYLLNAGTSAQSTLLGNSKVTYESLYVSRGLVKKVDYRQATLAEAYP